MHYVTELLIAFNANKHFAYLEIFKVSAIRVL